MRINFWQVPNAIELSLAKELKTRKMPPSRLITHTSEVTAVRKVNYNKKFSEEKKLNRMHGLHDTQVRLQVKSCRRTCEACQCRLS